jgi:phage terminase large subunit-like protein
MADDAPDPQKLLKLAKQSLSSSELRRKFHLLDFWGPQQFYPSQLKFFEAGSHAHQRLLMAGNQIGKTWSAACEVAWHLTGDYPAWWRGRRFKGPIRCWVVGPTGQLVRDGVQRQLTSKGGEFGSGTIPLATFARQPVMVPGGTGAIDTLHVTHRTNGVVDGTSELTFKSFEMRREKLQSESVHLIWIDEQPAEELYSELFARTTATDGIIIVTYTPIMGAGALTHRFLNEPSPDRAEIRITADEAKHISLERRAEMEAGYQEYERDTRIHGIPAMGRGRVFPFPAEDLVRSLNPDTDIKSYARHIIGVDFGYGHSFAAAYCAWVHDTGEFYVIDTFTMSRSSAVHHCQRIASMCKGFRIPIAWPHDGMTHEKASGHQLAASYRAYGAPLLPKHAENKGGGYALEPAIADLYETMATGKFVVASHCHEFIEEYLSYHRDDDLKVVALRDDVLSAVRYAHMMRRSGKPLSECGGTSSYGSPYNRGGGGGSAGGAIPVARDMDWDPFTGR